MNSVKNLPRALNVSYVQLRELYDLFDMKQIIKELTRVALDTSTLIDHIATTNCSNITES